MIKSSTAYCNAWGAEMGARRVHGLTADEKKAIVSGETVLIDAPEYAGQTVRRVVKIKSGFYARMPVKEQS